jgi:hypothetical protein
MAQFFLLQSRWLMMSLTIISDQNLTLTKTSGHAFLAIYLLSRFLGGNDFDHLILQECFILQFFVRA